MAQAHALEKLCAAPGADSVNEKRAESVIEKNWIKSATANLLFMCGIPPVKTLSSSGLFSLATIHAIMALERNDTRYVAPQRRPTVHPGFTVVARILDLL